nr:LCP family protein [Wenjunlia vitaminophila]
MLKAGVLSLSAIILISTGSGWLYLEHLNGNIRKGERSSGDSAVKKTKPNAHGQTPLNILLLGSDSRKSKANVALGGSKKDADRPPLADVQMLLHLSADRKSAALVSIPRDTRVDIPRCEDPKTGEVFEATNATINNTLARGGPGCTLATWQNLTDTYIDHWMMIDFSGVVSMADAVGGVEVCVNQNIWDRNLQTGRGGSGLKLEAGEQKVKGEKALQWLRTRYAFGSDINRTRAQRMYLNSMVRELKSQNVFTDTGRLMGLAETATDALTVDEGLGSVPALYDLGMEFKSIPSSRITSTTLPTVADPLDPDAHLIPAPGDAEQVFSMIRNDIPFDGKGKVKTKKKPEKAGPPAAPSDTIPVTVINGTGVNGKPAVGKRASGLAETLVAAGFTQAEAGSEPLPREETRIEYPAAEGDQGRSNAQAVAKALKIPVGQVKVSSEVTEITLVVGGDWPEGTDYSVTIPKENKKVPKSANPLKGDEKGCMDVYEPYRW